MSFLEKNAAGIPLLGFGLGTYYFKRSDNQPVNNELVTTLVSAVKNGFHHIDAAECYRNDVELGDALSKITETIPREDLFITDKYYSGLGDFSDHSKFLNPYDRLEKLLKQIDTPYVDLYLLHSPFIKEETHGFDLKGAWKYMQKALDDGLAKRIGVSNFTVDNLKEIWDTADSNPTVNQIEYNALLQNQTPNIVEWSQEHGITIEAYSPLGPLTKRKLTESNETGLEFLKLLTSLSDKYGKTETQILLRWVIQRGIVPITTTSKSERLDELKGVFGWKLDDADEKLITDLGLKFKPVLRQYWKGDFGKYDDEL